MPRFPAPCLCGAEDCRACHPEWNPKRNRIDEGLHPDWKEWKDDKSTSEAKDDKCQP